MLDPQSTENKIEKSNLVLEEFGNKFYFQTSEDGMLQYGSVACNSVTQYDKPFVKLKFPFSYGNKVTGNYSGTQTAGTSVVEVSGTYEIFADAYGSLLLPDDVIFENVLRVKQTRLINYKNSSNQIKEITYRWYDKDVRYPVLVIVKYETENNANIAEIAMYSEAINHKKSAQLSAAIENIHGLTNVNAYPNPFDEVLNISYNLDKDSKVIIDLYDVSGKLYKNVLQTSQDGGLHNLELSSSQLNMMPGVYYVKIYAGNQMFIKKVIKQ
jgi:hypothetical protein